MTTSSQTSNALIPLPLPTESSPVSPLGTTNPSYDRLNAFQYLAAEVPEAIGAWRAKGESSYRKSRATELTFFQQRSYNKT